MVGLKVGSGFKLEFSGYSYGKAYVYFAYLQKCFYKFRILRQVSEGQTLLPRLLFFNVHIKVFTHFFIKISFRKGKSEEQICWPSLLI